jgi:hypothetical protein
MLSAAYRQSSADNTAAAAIDPSNRLLWRFNRRRLDLEAMRDALLAAGGELDLTPGGRPVDLLNSTRRSVYGKVDRQFLPGVFRTFDFANPDLHMPQRPSTTVPQQALFFMNSTFLADRARALAKRPDVAAAPTPRERVARMYRQLFQRPPTDRQVDAAVRFVEQSQASVAPPPTAPPPKPTAWQYGYGEVEPTTRRLKNFEKLPHFTGDAWQGGAKWPDEKLGWVRLTAAGGHAGNDLAHAAVRRWTAPRDVTVSVSGTVSHQHAEGDGVVATIVSSRDGPLATYTLHNRKAETRLEPLTVKKGDMLDFVVDFRADLNSDDFEWSPTIKVLDAAAKADEPRAWDARKEFAGTPAAPPAPLNAWEQLAQVLLASNEFLFVD